MAKATRGGCRGAAGMGSGERVEGAEGRGVGGREGGVTHQTCLLVKVGVGVGQVARAEMWGAFAAAFRLAGRSVKRGGMSRAVTFAYGRYRVNLFENPAPTKFYQALAENYYRSPPS